MNTSVTDKDIIFAWTTMYNIRQVCIQLNISRHRLFKCLASYDIPVSETHEKILDMWNDGKTLKQISEELKLDARYIEPFLPRRRNTVYGLHSSDVAKRIYRCRLLKKQKMKLNNC